MSASSIARWNAISMTRQDASGFTSKRKRQEDDMQEDDDEDDDISLVSRSPSPRNDDMDVDSGDHTSKYDEFVRKPTRETITVDTKIKPSNKGFTLLEKMGWSEGQPLGLSGDGRVDPIPFEIKQDTLGIGRATQESLMIEETVSNRRELDSERQTKESDEQRRTREDAAARKAAVQDEITNTLRAFYCALCDKQFQTVAQYDEHTNSYAHHHKARAKDMQANARPKPKEEIDKRKEKERKREEKELRKIAAAAGIKMPKASSFAGSSVAEAPSPSMDVETVETASSSGRQGDLASVGLSQGFKKSGWATVGAPAPPPQPPSNSSSEWASVLSATPSSTSAPTASHPPSFRTGGWTSLDTGSTILAQPPPPPPAEPATTPPAPVPSSSHSHSQSAQPIMRGTSRGGWTSISASSSFTTTSAATPPPSYHHPEAPVPPEPESITSTPPSRPAPPKAESTRSGWQKFQAKNLKHK